LLTSFLTCMCGSSDPSAPDAAPPRYPHVRRRKRRTPDCQVRECDEESALVVRLLLEKVVPFLEGCGPYLLGGTPPTPSSIRNTGLIDGVPLPTLKGFTTFVTHYDFYTIMDQIHLNLLVDQIQLALGHISNNIVT
jgi:hypothetical protein